MKTFAAILALAALSACTCRTGPPLPNLYPTEIRMDAESAYVYDTLLSVMPVKQPLLVPIQHEGQERYQLVKPWGFSVHGADIDVPVGLVVDGASVPRAVWSFMPPDGLHRAAAFAHDFAYLHQGHLGAVTLTREQTDQLFYNLMVEAGVSPRRAGIAYRAVRMFGQSAWNSVEEPLILPVDLYQAPSRKAVPHIRHLYSEPTVKLIP